MSEVRRARLNQVSHLHYMARWVVEFPREGHKISEIFGQIILENKAFQKLKVANNVKRKLHLNLYF